VLAALGLVAALSGCAAPSVEPMASYRPWLQGEPFGPDYVPPPRRLTSWEAEAVIARAITEHEMRKP
jgi:hypothetical protein